MLRSIRKRLFSHATQTSQSTSRRRHSLTRKQVVAHDSTSERSGIEERNARSAAESRRQTRSLSAGPRRDKAKSRQRDRQEARVNRSVTKTNGQLSSRTAKRANSLPAKAKSRKNRPTAEEPRNCKDHSTDVRKKSEPLGEQLGKHKVATWLLGDEVHRPQVPLRPQQVPLNMHRSAPGPLGDRGVGASWTSATTLNYPPQPIYANQEFVRPPPLPHLSPQSRLQKESPLQGRFGGVPLGQPSVPFKLPPHVSYFSPMQSAAWSGAESRALVDAKPAKWPWTSDAREHMADKILYSEGGTRLSHKELPSRSSVPPSRAKSRIKSAPDVLPSDSKHRSQRNEKNDKKRIAKSKVSKEAAASGNKLKRGLLASLTLRQTKPKLLSPTVKSHSTDARSSRRNDEKRHSRAKKEMTSKMSRIQGGDRVGWEYHTVSLSRVPVYGFGIAVSGGRDNPHFMNGDPSIAISDVLKAGPAEGKLMVNDRVISVNGVSLENVDYNQAISVLRECGNAVNLLIKRRALVTQSTNGNIAVTEPNNNPIKVTLTKASKKDDFGIVLGCKIYVKEITNRVAVNEKDASLQEGDIIYKINSSSIEGLTLKEARKLLDSCKEKVSLVVSREASPLANLINNRFLSENGNYINGHSGRNGGAHVPISGFNNSHQRWPSFVGEQPPGNANSKPDDLYTNQNEAATSLNNNSGLAAMANGRVSNGWNNQNLYVQPPTRAEYQQMNSQNNLSTLNESNEANDSNSTIGSRIRGPLADISLTQLDQPATPLLTSHSARSGVETTDSPARPLPQRPAQHATSTPDSSPAKKPEPVELEPATKRSQPNTAEIRYISFHKEGSVGLRLTGGNEVGIFVTAVQPGSPASLQGLQVGDKILKANGTDMKNFTREEAVLYLLRIQDKIELVVANCKQEYDNIVASQKGDSFYIRVHFNYDSDGKGELSFHVGDIFHVVDTLHNGVVGSWLVYRLGRNNQEIQKGSIPNKSRADELAAEQKLESRSKKSLSGSELNEGKRGNFFKRRRSARRSKSLSKDHWEDVIFGDGSSKFAAYERVTLKHPGFTRPVVFFGPLADIAREKFLRDHPEKYASPQALQVNDEESPKSTKLTSSGIVRLSSIKDVVSTGKHALLDITPSAVDRLNYAQFYPIVIFMRAENKSIVKELRSRSSSKSTVHRSSRKLFDQSLKLEKLWHHIFTSAVTLTSGGDLWYKKLHETIEKEQSNTIWVAETKPEENISDDFLFPMISRLSYASSPESDLDISANDSRLDEEDNEKDSFRANSAVGGRLVKASSDPSLAHPEQAPATVGSAGEQTTDSAKKSNALQENAKPSGSNDSPNQRSPSKQLPLHILLRKELSKALHYESKDKDRVDEQSKGASVEELKQRRLSARLDEVGNYPTLRASDKYPQEVSMYSPKKRESPLPPPPPTTLPPSTSSFTSKGQPKQQYVEAPPRIDRNSKPSRFRSAHERLFGSKSIFASLGNYQNDDSDYINTISPAKYDEPPPPPSPQKATPNVAGQQQQRIVTGAFGDSSSYSSDSYNKYGSANSTLDTANGHARPPVGSEPYKPPRRSAPQLSLSSTLSSKHSSLERNKPLPPPPFLNGSKVEPPIPLTSSFSKAPPPSPPPKPTSKFVTPLQYQMNALTLNDTRPPPPPKPLNMPPPPVPGSMYDKQIQSDYDNMPAMLPSLPSKRPGPAFHGALDISNGPPGYYQSLPQSSYAHHHSKDSQPRYSSTAETISNFINGTGGNSNSNNEPTYNSFNSLRRPSSSYLEVSGESTLGKSPSKPNYPSNYEHMRYNSFSSSSVYPNGSSSLGYPHQGAHNNGPYLNVPYPSKSPYSQEPGQGPYSMGVHGQGSQSSPLPPPPPLPTYTQPPLSSGGHVLQPTPQQPQSGQYLDLSLNRENRGSAFEVYRKPVMGSMHAVGLSDSPLFHGLPPPPPPLTVNDYNQPNYCNLDEITSSAMFSSGGGGHGSASDATVIAAAHGLFDCEGGSLTDRQTGVSLIIPPGAISEGVTQEIYFKVCRDHSLAPPLDKTKGETLLSPIVMCGPRGLRFHEPVELRLPHCIDVDASWSVALKSSDTSNGEPAGWRNISINNDRDGIAGNDFKDQFVTVQVDHF